MPAGFDVRCDDGDTRQWLMDWLARTRLEPGSPIVLDARIEEQVRGYSDARRPFRQSDVEIRSGPPDEDVRITWRADQAVARIDRTKSHAQVAISRAALGDRENLAQGFLVPVVVFLLRRVGWHHVHAATARDPRGRGWLLAGDAGCGKSTTSALLARKGWAVGGDDLSFLDAATDPVEVVAMRAPIALREGGLALLARSDGAPLRQGRKRGFFPEELGGHWLDRVRPDVVAFPLVEGGRTSVEPLARREALAELVRWSAWVALEPALSQPHLDALARLAAQAACVRLRLGPDLAGAPDLLLSLTP